ncbi:hypothetical protein Bca4012_058332 [Brassica carinata]|uniref:Uncharacterized protein n=1 Tax=Brassica carinata TaxID=52824 RepID=A0A8X7W3U2_BRACI|nr:hypothetical protein Bca52824_016074 [Brassica carinata]
MTRKKLNPLEDPPTASSSHEDEADALSGRDDEEEQISDDSSSDEEDDLMNPVKIPSKSEKPIASVTNPKGGSLALKKRPIEMTSVNAKRAKIAEETKKPSSQRLWSEEDEISVLQGMIDFKADTGKSPYEDMDRFYELTSKSISFEASKIQFVDKIRSLKRKYMGKVKQGVESLAKDHDIKCLKLAKHIWGSHGMALNSNVKKTEKSLVVKRWLKKKKNLQLTPESTAKSNGTPKKSKKKPILVEVNGDKVEEDREVLVNGDNGGEDREVLAGGEKGEEDREVLANGKKVDEHREVLTNGDKVEEDKEALIDAGGASKSLGVMRASDWFEDSFLVGSITSLGVSERFVKEKWSMVTVETKKRMEEKWKLLQAKEMELVLHKTDFMREIGSVIAEAS